MIDYTENVDTIAQFGPAFQSKVIAAMMKDPKFLGQSMDVVNPFFFDSDAGRWVCNKVIDFYQKYKDSPGLDYFKAEMVGMDDKSTLRTEVISFLREAWSYTTHAGDLEYVQDKFLDFAKNQTLKNAILKSADLLQRGDYGQIKTLVDQAMKAGTQKDIGLMWLEDIDTRHIRLNETYEPTETTLNLDEQILVAKFLREELASIFELGEVTLTITGQLLDETEFAGTDTMRVISPGPKKNK